MRVLIFLEDVFDEVESDVVVVKIFGANDFKNLFFLDL